MPVPVPVYLIGGPADLTKMVVGAGFAPHHELRVPVYKEPDLRAAPVTPVSLKMETTAALYRALGPLRRGRGYVYEHVGDEYV